MDIHSVKFWFETIFTGQRTKVCCVLVDIQLGLLGEIVENEGEQARAQ